MRGPILLVASQILAYACAQSPFQKYTISAPGINASFIPYGARLTNLFVNDKYGNPQDVVLGYDSGSQYLTDTETVHTYFGAVVGRYANRIKNGTFTVHGVTSHIPENEHNGADTLHGGTVGYDQVCKKCCTTSSYER
jgi:aldose 1-epimerase